MMFKKLSKYDNLFLEQDSMELYSLVNGEMQRIQSAAISAQKSKEDKIIDALENQNTGFVDRLAAMDAKVASGEISCNLDNPEDCINCGS